MSDLTTDPNDPRLGHGSDSAPKPQNEAYLVLSAEERARGFVAPVRRKYVHVGVGGHEVDPADPRRHGRTGSACGVETTMSREIAETYARDPKFYGSTYCVGCAMHLPVAEFKWSNTDEVVGSMHQEKGERPAVAQTIMDEEQRRMEWDRQQAAKAAAKEQAERERAK